MTTPQTTSRLDAIPGLGRAPADVMRRIELLERLLEGLFVVPGINRPIGLDAIVGLLPVAGDAVMGAVGLWIVWEARTLGLPRWKLLRMIANIAIDTGLGSIPIAGDAFDFLFRSNSMNVKIIRKHVARHHPELAVVKR
jgi:hypothetical protein